MKKYFNILLLVFLVTSCSKDEDEVVYPAPTGEEIPADKKFVSLVDRWEEDLKFTYYPNGKVDNVMVGTQTYIKVDYEGDRIWRFKYYSNIYESYFYEFAYNDAGVLTGYFRYNITNYELVSYQPLVFNAATNSYNDWLYFYDNGSIKRVISGDLDRTLVYDTTKKGAFFNADQNLIKYLMIANRNVILWPAYVGRYPCKEVIQQQGVVEMQNTFDSQTFITKSHMDSTNGELTSNYTYIEL